MGRMHDKYLIADGKTYILGGRNTYNYFLGEFPGHKNYDRDVLVVCENPQADSSVNQLLAYFLDTLIQVFHFDHICLHGLYPEISISHFTYILT